METRRQVERGCGRRKQHALYLCTALSPDGAPIEDFVLDPARPFRGGAFRAPMLLERPGGCDVLIWVGSEYYPFVPDFIEEARQMGVSRRIPFNFPLERLAEHPRMFLIHPRAIQDFGYRVEWTGRRPKHACRLPERRHRCTFDLWPLSLLESMERHEVEGRRVKTPSCAYEVGASVSELECCPVYRPGLFAAFYITHLEYVNRDRKVPEPLWRRAREAGLAVEVMEE